MDFKEETKHLQGRYFEHELTAMDCLYPGVHSKRIYIFRQQDVYTPERATEIIEQGLKHLVDRLPMLAGIITIDTPGPQKGFKSITPGPGLLFKVRHLESKLEFAELEREGFPCHRLENDLLVPTDVVPQWTGQFPAACFQLNHIKGGMLLAVSVAHVIADGNAVNKIIEELAEECRKITEGIPSIMTPFVTDNSWEKTMKDDEYAHLDEHPAYDWWDGESELLTMPPEWVLDDQYIPKMYHITRENLDALKEAALATTRISSHDALVGLAWRTLMKARLEAGLLDNASRKVGVFFPTNAREKVGVDSGYIGNMIIHLFAELPFETLLAEDGLAKAVATIREGLGRLDAPHIRAITQLQRETPMVGQIRWSALLDMHTYNILSGSSWKDRIYEFDWGSVFGQVVRFRSSQFGFLGALKGACFVMPKLLDGSCEFQLYVNPELQKLLDEDKLFTKYCTRIEK